jgi:uncharacterized membrane protein YfcA
MDNLIFLFFIGFISGIFTGFFGVGGGFFLTPALNILGLQIVYAIGTGFFALIGKALFGAWRHMRLGNGHLKLGLIVGLSSIGGVEFGKRFVLYLERQNLAGTSIRATYIFILILISFFMLRDYLSRTKKTEGNQKGKGTQDQEKIFLPMRIVSKIGLSPKIMLPQSELVSVSCWVLVAVGVLIGFLSGLLGVGGGFIALPFLIYVLGVPAIMAVGTSLIIVFFTSSYGAFSYAITGHVEWTIAVFILIGSLLGIQLGVAAVKTVAEIRIKVLFALLLFCIAVSVFLKQIELTIVSSYLVVSGALVLCLIILYPIGRDFLARALHRKKKNFFF